MKSVKDRCLSILSTVISIYPRFFNAVLRLFYSEPERIVMYSVCKGMENKKLHVYFKLAPRDTLEIPTADLSSELLASEAFAIVMQGSIPENLQFIIDSIRFYRKIYSQSVIIVSTWDDEDVEKVKALEKAGATVVQSAKPQRCGIHNVNYQLVNSLAGIKKAKEMGCQYAVKTRTDQRICRPFLFDNMRTMLEKIPPRSDSTQRKRIAILNHSNMFTPYFMCDFLYYGTTDDLLNLLSAPLDDRAPFEMCVNATRREYSQKMYPPEIYIVKHYLHKYLGFDCKNDVESYWKAVKDYFICYSTKEADILWPKYKGQYELNRRYGDYFGYEDSEERVETMSFNLLNWLNLYYGTLTYKKEYEKYADELMNSAKRMA